MLLAVTVLVIASACSSTTRPSADDWRSEWDRVMAGVPAIAEIGDPPNGDVCREGLGFLRANRGDLFPTPDKAIDDAVNDWVMTAEDALFECPPSSRSVPSFEAAYDQLSVLEAEVEAVLGLVDG